MISFNAKDLKLIFLFFFDFKIISAINEPKPPMLTFSSIVSTLLVLILFKIKFSLIGFKVGILINLILYPLRLRVFTELCTFSKMFPVVKIVNWLPLVRIVSLILFIFLDKNPYLVLYLILQN